MTKKSSFLIIAVLLSGLFMQSCTLAKISGKGAVPLLLNQPGEKMQLVAHIKVKKNVNFDYTGSFDVSEVIAQRIVEAQPDAVINTTVTIKTGVDNWLLNVVTLGLANSRKFVIEADLMREKN
jgi:hypothetical protein